ncbi:SseB family protein [Intrasporangium mesophilum]
MTGPAHHDHSAAHLDAQGRPADSAGQAWAGKNIPSHGFADDTGAADPKVLALLEGRARSASATAASAASGASGASEASVADAAETGETEADLVAHVARTRWLVPVVAVASDVDESGEHRVETRSDMAAVILNAPDGQRALPMFTSLASLSAWDPDARPVPVSAAAAARAAIGEECHVLVVDLGSPHTTVLRPSMLWALALEREWRPSHDDEHVAAAVAAAVRGEEAVAGHRLEAGEPAGAGVLRVVLVLRPGLGADDVQALATRIGERIATDGETRARIDALTFALETAR